MPAHSLYSVSSYSTPSDLLCTAEEHLVIPMHHDHDADGAGGKAPGVLPHQLPAGVLCLKGDVEHAAEVLPQAVGGAALQADPPL